MLPICFFGSKAAIQSTLQSVRFILFICWQLQHLYHFSCLFRTNYTDLADNIDPLFCGSILSANKTLSKSSTTTYSFFYCLHFQAKRDFYLFFLKVFFQFHTRYGRVPQSLNSSTKLLCECFCISKYRISVTSYIAVPM